MKIVAIIFAISSLFSVERYRETLFPSWGQSFNITAMIHEEKTDLWNIAIFDNPIFGRVLAVDGVIQLTEKDEAIYHEMLVHPALIAHDHPTSVLIVGGGDGGALREVLRHNDVARVILVEIDRRIMDLTQKYFPSLAGHAFSDPRLEIVIGDPVQYVKECREMFDIILCDSGDPIGTGASFFTKEFYGDCKKRLNEAGILVNQNGVPFIQTEEYNSSVKRRKAHFGNVTFYLASIPSYIGGVMAFGWASDVKHIIPLETMKKRMGKVSGKMKYYTPSIHKASFALPSYLLPEEKEAKTEAKHVKKKGKEEKKFPKN